ncbi:replication initiation protein [Mycobacterium phage Sbash]|uniref:Helix-turn-helix DNA binding domain protein n=1 Tax=Mycobacterium phage Sbash TaxID=1567475 RepID=A0A0A7RVZ8_9CAUD|nr:replication initiation protein [Mycobacterium phage Sbash]AJA43378.1 hypothetical protein PBI_SBASH_77 [Mycobacterium phage Sbash]
MPRDHARINLDLWGDDDWMDLSVDAQMLYLTLYTNPGLSFCGAGEWHTGRIANRARDWTRERVEAAAAELSRRLFVIIDTDTDEYLIRSWIKHDGLWRTPNMAVTVANARGDLSSKALRGVVVFEVAKLRNAYPDSSAWDRPAVQKMLTQRAIDAADLEPYNPGSNPASKGGANPCANPGSKGGGTGELTPPLRVTEREANPGSKGGPTPAPTPAPKDSSPLTLVEGGVGGDPQNLPVAQSAPAAPAAKAPRGSRLPEGWMPDDETIAAMRQQFPHVDLRAEHEKFTDYWRGTAGAKGRKADWTATWRNWIRRADENAPRTSASAPAASNGLGKPSQKALGWEKAGEALIAELEGRR